MRPKNQHFCKFPGAAGAASPGTILENYCSKVFREGYTSFINGIINVSGALNQQNSRHIL